MAERLRDMLAETFDYAAGRTRARLEGLTDDEYLWEPVAGCWTVHPGPRPWVDWESPPPDPAPVTTIAWRLVHTISNLSEHGLRKVAFERGQADWRPPSVIPAGAADALAELDRAIGVWRGDLAGAADERLWEPLGPEAGPYADASVASYVEHIHDEFIHHSAEVALLRDLYRARPVGSVSG